MTDFNTETEAGRREIRDRFFEMFGIYRDEEIARKLNTSERTVARGRAHERVPQSVQAKAMVEFLERGIASFVISDEELARRGEEQRAHREAQQKFSKHTELIGKLKEVPVPKWYSLSRDFIEQSRWDEALAILDYWATDDKDGGFSQIPKPTCPYVLQSYGLSLYYKGLYREAGIAWERAHKLAVDSKIIRIALLGIKLMKCSASWRQRLFTEAFEGYDKLVILSPDYHYTYYNAICAADFARDASVLSKWIGRLQVAARDHFSPEAIEEILERARDDPDLRWARLQNGWSDLIRWLEEIAASAQRPTSR